MRLFTLLSIGCAGAVAMIASASPAESGQTFTWFVAPHGTIPSTYWPADGAFEDPLKWRDEEGNTGVPGSADTAVFDFPSVFTVTFAEDHANDRLILHRGFITFDLAAEDGPAHYTLLNPLHPSPSIVIGAEGDDMTALTVSGGTLSGVFTDIGQQPGAFGLLTVKGAGSALNTEWHLHIGEKGAGIFEVLGGATATNHSAGIAVGAGAFGQALVRGEGSQWLSTGSLDIGQGGFGSLLIDQQGFVSSASAILAKTAASIATVEVSGPGTEWQIIANMNVGMRSPGTLTIADGALLTNAVYASIGTLTDPPTFFATEAQGEVIVRDAGSAWLSDGNVFVGTQAIGSLRLSRGGTVALSGDLIRGVVPSVTQLANRLHFEFATAGDYQSVFAIDVGGSADDFIIEVHLVDDFSPPLGTKFHLITAEELGEYLLDLPPLPQPLGWFIEQADHDLILHVTETVTGDLNNDGVVNTDDLLILLANWGECPDIGHCPADLSGDGNVGVDDLVILLANWSP